MSIKKAKEQIEQAMMAYLSPTTSADVRGLLKQALAALETEPSEFTKQCHHPRTYPQAFGKLTWKEILFEACDIIDADKATISRLKTENANLKETMIAEHYAPEKVSPFDLLKKGYDRQTKLLHRHRICITCGKQLSKAEAYSVHSCLDEQALKNGSRMEDTNGKEE